MQCNVKCTFTFYNTYRSVSILCTKIKGGREETENITV